jgi:hypothetical protein
MRSQTTAMSQEMFMQWDRIRSSCMQYERNIPSSNISRGRFLSKPIQLGCPFPGRLISPIREDRQFNLSKAESGSTMCSLWVKLLFGVDLYIHHLNVSHFVKKNKCTILFHISQLLYRFRSAFSSAIIPLFLHWGVVIRSCWCHFDPITRTWFLYPHFERL